MNLIIFGPQGSGKGTQAKVIAEKLNIPHISTGDIFRDNINNQTDLGRKAKKYMDVGQLVPDDIVIEMIKVRLSQTDCRPGFILDGYPRTILQAEVLDKITEIDKVLEVWISDKESVSRISGRRSCPIDGSVYHIKYNPPKEEGRCDKCQGKLLVRGDDTEPVIIKRLAQYHEQTEPLKKYYQKQSKLIEVDGMPPIKDVTKEIFEKLRITN